LVVIAYGCAVAERSQKPDCVWIDAVVNVTDCVCKLMYQFHWRLLRALRYIVVKLCC